VIVESFQLTDAQLNQATYSAALIRFTGELDSDSTESFVLRHRFAIQNLA
jgi:hypothetical protein